VAAKDADVTVLAVGLGAIMEAEGNDRVNMTLPSNQRALLEAVSKVAKKLILVVVSAGGVDLDEVGQKEKTGISRSTTHFRVDDCTLAD
jgi:hypothetical protein